MFHTGPCHPEAYVSGLQFLYVVVEFLNAGPRVPHDVTSLREFFEAEIILLTRLTPFHVCLLHSLQKGLGPVQRVLVGLGYIKLSHPKTFSRLSSARRSRLVFPQ